MIATHLVKISFFTNSDKNLKELHQEQLERFRPVFGDALENIEIEDMREGES